MKNKYFAGASEWQENDVHTTGLPRPWATPKRKDLAKKVPIPWQSEDRFESLGHLGLNQNNENVVYEKDLCSYCGIKIKNKEISIRWINAPLAFTSKEGPKVFSDFHPLHLECMEQARIFCPHMRKLENSEFEIGKYKELKQNAINDVIKSKELNSVSNWFRLADQKNIQENVQP
jgi:hypothetical protein